MKNKLLKACRIVAIVAASVSLVCNVICENWICASINVATLVIVI